MKKTSSVILALAIAATSIGQNTYTMDKDHSKLSFSARHLGVSHVEGNFLNFNAQLKSQKEDFTDAIVEMTAETKSINTDVELRDRDLRKPAWLDATKNPTITFKNTSFKKTSEKNYIMEGKITIKGITKPISFDVTYNGKTQNSKTLKYVVGFTVNGKLNRSDFGVGTDTSLDSFVSDEIQVKSNVEFIINQVLAGKE